MNEMPLAQTTEDALVVLDSVHDYYKNLTDEKIPGFVGAVIDFNNLEAINEVLQTECKIPLRFNNISLNVYDRSICYGSISVKYNDLRDVFTKIVDEIYKQTGLTFNKEAKDEQFHKMYEVMEDVKKHNDGYLELVDFDRPDFMEAFEANYLPISTKYGDMEINLVDGALRFDGTELEGDDEFFVNAKFMGAITESSLIERHR